MTTPRLGIRERIESDLRMARMTARLAPIALANRGSSSSTVPDRWEQQVDDHPERVALVDASDDGRTVTYLELDRLANRVAHWGLDQGLEPGDVVALCMANRPEYVATWLGLAKIGVVTALVNTNLTGEPLHHSIAVSGAGHLVIDHTLAPHWHDARGDLDLVELDFTPGWPELTGLDTERPDRTHRPALHCSDRLLYIYTSGTTGLPKAASFTHGKFLTVAAGAAAMVDTTPDDRTYITLPLYHTAGGVMALGGALWHGGTAITVERFSASRFWDDCVEHHATTFQYIGELCRYLVNSPAHPRERDHSLRVCLGNGLRPDVWPEFQDRFAIGRIIEFYGATEGTASLVNLDNRIGAIGRMRPRIARRLGLHLVRHDPETGDIARDDRGRVIEVGPDEPGEFISRISSMTPFEGYHDDAATEAKILRDAFRDGDAYFRSGDLLSQDRDGYYTFVDRVGDTFRWKGENVSTAEVAAVLGHAPGVREANVYGVAVPGADGRAGMASLVVDDDFDLDAFAAHAAAELAGYARPVFLRLRDRMEVTATFKHRKVDDVALGFDPDVIDDPLLFLDHDTGGYLTLDPAAHARIVAGDVRL